MKIRMSPFSLFARLLLASGVGNCYAHHDWILLMVGVGYLVFVFVCDEKVRA